MGSYSRLVIIMLLMFLAACNAPAPQPTPTLRGPIVPTRVIPTPGGDVIGVGTEIVRNVTPSVDVTVEVTTEVSGNIPTEATEAVTEEPSPTDTAEADTPTSTPTETVTPTDTPTPSETPSITPSITPSPSETPTDTPTPTPTPTVQAVGPIAINYGDRIEGEITNETPELLYTFSGNQGDVVNISMTATGGDLDTYLLILAENGVKLTENDDVARGSDTNSRIAGYVLPSDATYTIVATRYQRAEGTTTGTFELVLELGVIDDRPVVVLDEVVEGRINDGRPFSAFRFDGEANQVIDIAVDGDDDLNPMVILYAPDGHEYARNDDESRRETDALIDGIRLPETGSYSIVVTRYQGEFGITQGDFELEVTEADPADSPSTVLSRPIEYGASEEGSIGDDLPYYQIFTFRGRAGDVVTLLMSATSDDLDTLVILKGPEGREIVRNDDDLTRGSTTDSAIHNIILPVDGFYTIVAARFDEAVGESTGEFELEVVLELGADESDVRALIAPMDIRVSGAVREDATYYEPPFFVAGDYVNNDDDEVIMQTVLTFLLPPLPPNAVIDYAELELSACREIGEGFRGLGDLTVYIDEFRDLPTVDPEPSSRADEVETIDDCQPVVISDAVVTAYEDAQNMLQIRLGFEDGINRNEEADYIWFDPRLTIYFAN